MKIIKGRASANEDSMADEELIDALRAVYAAPSDESYWSGLEGRIMARLRRAEEQGEWWGVLAEWRTTGLIAAGLMLSLAGAALWRDSQQNADARRLAAGAAYWTVFQGPTNDINIAFTVPSSPAEDAAERLLFMSEP